jgi:hypothetical protein
MEAVGQQMQESVVFTSGAYVNVGVLELFSQFLNAVINLSR